MDRDLLEDLIEYRKSKDKGVMVAARGLLQLFREVNPELLKRRERGKVASMAIQAGEETAQPLRFGEERDVATGIDGLDVSLNNYFLSLFLFLSMLMLSFHLIALR